MWAKVSSMEFGGMIFFRPRPRAVICANNPIALSLMQALQKLRHPATQIQTYIITPTLVCRGTTPGKA